MWMWIILSTALLALTAAEDSLHDETSTYHSPAYGSSSYSVPSYKYPEYKQPNYSPPEYKSPEQGRLGYVPPEYKRPEAPYYSDADYKNADYMGPELKRYKPVAYRPTEYKTEYPPADYSSTEPEYEGSTYEDNEPHYKHSRYAYRKLGYSDDVNYRRHPDPKYSSEETSDSVDGRRRFSRYGSFVRPVGYDGKETRKFAHSGAVMKDDKYDDGDKKNTEYETRETYEMEYKKRQPVGKNGYRDEVEQRTVKRVYSYDKEATKDGRPGYHDNGYHDNGYHRNDFHNDGFYGTPYYSDYHYTY